MKSVEKLESRMADQARLKPLSTALSNVLPFFNSSLMRSKIKMFASTAMPIERITPAKPARVRVTPVVRRLLKKKKPAPARMNEMNLSQPESSLW